MQNNIIVGSFSVNQPICNYGKSFFFQLLLHWCQLQQSLEGHVLNIYIFYHYQELLNNTNLQELFHDPQKQPLCTNKNLNQSPRIHNFREQAKGCHLLLLLQIKPTIQGQASLLHIIHNKNVVKGRNLRKENHLQIGSLVFYFSQLPCKEKFAYILFNFNRAKVL